MNENLLLKREKGYDKPIKTEKKKVFDFCEGYKEFIKGAKTERVFVKDAVKLLEQNGFKKFERGMDLKENNGKFCYQTLETACILAKNKKIKGLVTVKMNCR